VVESVRIAGTADVAADATIGAGTTVWHFAQIREGAVLGRGCVVGRCAYIGVGVEVGDNCKIQNNALVYEPARLGHGVFVGPSAVLTNDRFPRAINPDGTIKSSDDWRAVGVTVEEGASIGANATCIAPINVGRWALVGSGSTVVQDVPAFAVVVGTPARRIGWVGKAGRPLRPGMVAGEWTCPVTGDAYVEVDGVLSERPS
jgi:acetyltransferase-like isoleucine patch superfamily enzyme